MSINVSAAQINLFVQQTEAEANSAIKNGLVDTDKEIEIFRNKCIGAGITNFDEIVKNYKDNKVSQETSFLSRQATSADSVENAIIAALNSDTSLRKNDGSKLEAKTIKEAIKNAAGNHVSAPSYLGGAAAGAVVGSFFGFPIGTIVGGVVGLIGGGIYDLFANNETEILNSTQMITADNVLDVIDDQDVLKKIQTSDKDVREVASSQVLTALALAAEERNIDISNILVNINGAFLTGRDVPGAEMYSPASKYFTVIVNAINAKIKAGDSESGASPHKFTQLMKKSDANGNGYIDGDEAEGFKQAAFSLGVDINSVLQNVRDKVRKGQDITDETEKAVFNIFNPDPAKRLELNSEKSMAAKDVSRAIATGIGKGNNELSDFWWNGWTSGLVSGVKSIFEGDEVDYTDGNEEILNYAISQVNADNVIQVLNDNPDLINKIMNKYDHNWFTNMTGCDDKYDQYTRPILIALVELAQKRGVNVSDIILIKDNYTMTGTAAGTKAGENPLDADNVGKIITALHNRLKNEN